MSPSLAAAVAAQSGGGTAWRKDWDVANVSIRAANWGAGPESPVLGSFCVNNTPSLLQMIPPNTCWTRQEVTRTKKKNY